MNPVRTCVGCRTRSSRTDLLRVVIHSTTLVPDDRGGMPGRGAWVHETRECVTTAIRRRAFERALRVTGPVDTQILEKRLNGYGPEVNGSK